MNIFSVLTLLGGLAFFLFGMNCMSGGLEKLAGGKLQSTLKRMTSRTLTSILFGAGITIAIQSSSALTVMLVGLVNSGIMELGQTVGVIMGSNIGTTLTAWILSLAGLDSDVLILHLLKPESLAPIAALIGILMVMASKEKRHKDAGTVLLGFALLMYGMNMMSGAVEPLADMPEFQSILTAFNNPLLGVLVGTVFTGIIQSSAAAVGILLALSLTGSITYGMAIPIILGSNIGTCVTALLSSIGTTRNARRVGMIHILFNTIGTVICLSLFYLGDAIFNFTFKDMTINGFGVALCHTVFNLATTAMLLPFRKQLVTLAQLTIPEHASEKQPDKPAVMLDDRLLLSPGLAVSESFSATARMSALAHATVLDAMGLVMKFDPTVAASVKIGENELDIYEDKVGTFLVKVASADLTIEDSREVSKLLHNIGDLERIGDHALNISESAQEMYDKGLVFSDDARSELMVLMSALTEILSLAHASFEKDDLVSAGKVEPLEQVIDVLIAQIKRHHVERLQAGKCTIELGFVLNDIMNNCERISDHCSNIAVCVTESDRGSFDTHEYLNAIKTGNDAQFKANYELYAKKYELRN